MILLSCNDTLSTLVLGYRLKAWEESGKQRTAQEIGERGSEREEREGEIDKNSRGEYD